MSLGALVVLNPAARHGTARARFEAVAPLLRRQFALMVITTDPAGLWRAALARGVRGGVPVVLAAGGDGTVGAVASALLACPSAAGVTFGAIGLGSSNDFHKPFRVVHASVPLRIDVTGAAPRDVGRASFSVDGEPPDERQFLVSASLGVTARANAFFNQEHGGLFGLLKRRWVGGAVFYAALAALASHADVPGVLRLEGREGCFSISNLSVLKTPFLSGCLRFDTPVAADSGLLAVNLCHDMGRGALLGTLLALARGRFRDRAQTHHWLTPRLEVELPQPAPLELDGEVVTARQVAFDVLPRRILTCA